MIALIRSELYKVWKKKYILILLIIILLYDVLMYALNYTDSIFVGNLDTTGAGVLIQQGFDDFLLLVIGVLSANVVSVDFQNKRIRNILAKGYSKEKIYLSKLFSCIILSIATFLLSRFILVCTTTLLWGFDPNNVFHLSGLLFFLFLYILLTVAYASVFAALAFWGQSTGKAIMNNLLFLFIFPMLLLALSLLIKVDLTGFYMASSMEKLLTYNPMKIDIIRAIIVFAFYTIISSVCGYFVFKKREY